MTILRRARDILNAEPGAEVPFPERPVDDAWFAADVCHNCGNALTTPHCGQCGQKRAKRFVWRDIVRETWDRVRLFEIQSLRTTIRLIASPGRIARDYVLGRRARHMHPLKLLVALIAALALILAANSYFSVFAFEGRNSDVDRMATRVLAYANWSFSLGIIAIFAGSWSVFRRRLGYNAVEHAVLSIYCQSIILVLIILNLLPTLIWRDPAFILWHKAAAQYYVPTLKLLLVAIAYCQFFLLKLRRDWWRLGLACIVYAGVNWALLRVYAFVILWLVSR